MMKFHEKYLRVIGAGIKTSTIRKHCHVQEGMYIEAQFGTHVNYNSSNDSECESDHCWLKIVKITPVSFDSLTNDIARAEGFLHVDLLKAELKSIYTIRDDSELFYQIEFEVMPGVSCEEALKRNMERNRELKMDG